MKVILTLLMLAMATGVTIAQHPLSGTSLESYVLTVQRQYKQHNYFAALQPQPSISLLRTKPQIDYFAEQRYVLAQLRLAMATHTPPSLPMSVMDQTFYMSQAYQGRVFMGGEYFNPFANPYLGPAGYAVRGLLAPYYMPGTTARWVIR